MSQRMPVIFFGHGNPMNAISRNSYTEGWTQIGKQIPQPKAILSISAHWYLPETLVTAMNKPRRSMILAAFHANCIKFNILLPEIQRWQAGSRVYSHRYL